MNDNVMLLAYLLSPTAVFLVLMALAGLMTEKTQRRYKRYVFRSVTLL